MSDRFLFSPDYVTARRRFLAAARERGASLETITNPARSEAAGEPLCTDVAVIADSGADRALVLVSGTHGAEGFAGSACQLAVLRGMARLPPGVDLIAVHALNPFGFFHRRRVNEDNIDINRNFVDHSSPPVNHAYAQVHPNLVPEDWGGPAHTRADEALALQVRDLGARALQAAITAGQYDHPNGLFYGGSGPSWSNQVWRSIIRAYLQRYEAVAYIDLHTGLGSRNSVEPIFRGGTDARALDRARDWYGAALTESEAGTSSSTPIGGNTAHALAGELPAEVLLTAITAEFGTQDPLSVLRALQADNWLWQQDERSRRAHGAEPRSLMIEAFDPPDSSWRESVITHGLRVIRQSLSGLSSRGGQEIDQAGEA